MAMLEVKDLAVYYGMIHAIKGVSFEVNKGEIIALIGANGAGKTTILHTITGLLSPKRGSIQFEGKELTKIPAHKIVSLGMAHVPEGRRVFAELSVYQNLKLGAYTRSDKKEIEETMETVYQRFPRLRERKNQMAGTLSGGEQQRVAIARALVNEPAILFADEPSGNLDSKTKAEIHQLFFDLRQRYGQTIVIVTHDPDLARMCDRSLFMRDGQFVEE